MKTFNDLTETEKKEYSNIKLEMNELDKKIDSWEFKNKIEVKKEVLEKYLDLSFKENALIPHSRKRKFKDKAIKEVYEYALSALELKQKSRVKYERLKNNFNKLFSQKMNKILKKGKKE